MSIPSPQRFHDGIYRVVVTSNDISVTSEPVVFTVNQAAASPDARVSNMSTRALCQTGGNVLIPGFVIAGRPNKKLLIRAVGPTLSGSEYDVKGAMADPMLVVHRADGDGRSSEILSQDNWSENPDAAHTARVAEQVGAFPLSANSHDAAFVVTLAPGVYTVHATSADGVGTGIVLVEVYVVE